MLGELANAVFVTYLCTEYYLLVVDEKDLGSSSSSFKAVWASRRWLRLALWWVALNGLAFAAVARLPGILWRDAGYLLSGLEGPVAVAAFEAAILTSVFAAAVKRLFLRCKRREVFCFFAFAWVALYATGLSTLPARIAERCVLSSLAFCGTLYWDVARRQKVKAADFADALGAAVLYVVPVYPFLAIGISLLFLPIIMVFDYFHLSLKWMDGPLYYATLYGPLVQVYFKVKRHFNDQLTNLPTTFSKEQAGERSQLRR